MKRNDKAFMKSRIIGKNIPQAFIGDTCRHCCHWHNLSNVWCQLFNQREDILKDDTIQHILNETTKSVVLCKHFEDDFDRQ